MAGIQSNAQQTNKMNTLQSSGYAPVNGLKMYYEIHGAGRPLVLIHGSYMTIDLNYGQLIPILAKTHKVIALEMQGHGRTADIDRPYSFPAMADDIVGLLKYLKIDSADVLGYSLGATVALQLTIAHPSMVSKLVFISSVYKFDGWIKAARDIFPTMKPEFLEQTPLKTQYDALAPDKGHWREFVTKLTKFDAMPFDLGSEKVKAIKCPVLIIKGDNDGVELSHVSEMYQLLGGGTFADMTGLPPSQLAIVPGTTHVTLMMQTETLAGVITPFLDKK
jgi:pimeloyl-ACP methyl ester carboxylesterase